MAPKKIFGFVGQMASGKGTACQYLHERHGAATIRYSTMLRDVLTRLYLPQTRDNLIRVSEALRGAFGDNLMAEVVRQEIKDHVASVVCIDGIRRPQDIEILRQLPGFTLVHITAAMETRYERIQARNENADDRSKTFDMFVAEHERSTEQTIGEVAASADIEIDNNGAHAALIAQLDALIERT